MNLLSTVRHGNTVGVWLIAAAILIGTTGGLAIARLVVLRRLTPRNGGRALLLVVVRHTRYLFLAVVGMAAASAVVTLPTEAPHIIRVMVTLVILFQVAWWVHGLLSFWVRRVSRRRARIDLGSTTAIRAIGVAARLSIWLVLALAVLGTLGIDVTALLAGLGIGGVAIALAVQNIVGDLFASVSIILDKPFVVGDFIKVGEQLGTVEEIGIKTTRLRSLSGEQLIFGNGDLLESRIQNFKRMDERRVVFTLGVEYGTSPDAVEAIPAMIRHAISTQESTRPDRIHFKEYGDSALIYEAVYYVLSPDYNRYMDIQQAVNIALYRRLNAAGISFAFPTRTVMLRLDGPVAGGEERDPAGDRIAAALASACRGNPRPS